LLAANPAFWSKAVLEGSLFSSEDQEYTVVGEDFTVDLELTPKQFTKKITNPLVAISSTIYVGTIWHINKKLQMQLRAQYAARALGVLAEQGAELADMFSNIDAEVKALADIEDVEEARRRVNKITELTLLSQEVSRSMEADANALLYLNRAGQDDILLEQLRASQGDLKPGDIAVFQEWVDNPPRGIIDDWVLDSMAVLADPDDLMGIKQTVNQVKATTAEMTQLLTRSETFTNRVEALVEAAKRGEGLSDIDALSAALKSLQQGDLTVSFAQTTDDLAKLIPNLNTIGSTASAARDIGKRSAFFAKTVGRFFFWDTVYWLVTTGVDVALNPFVPEDEQRIPYLADLPAIGGLFDVSESVGTSPLNLVIDAAIDKVINWIVPESVAESFYSMLNQAIDTDDLSAWYILALTWWYDLGFNITLENLTIAMPALAIETSLPLTLDYEYDPLDILSVAVVACVAKIVFKGWVAPAFNLIREAF